MRLGLWIVVGFAAAAVFIIATVASFQFVTSNRVMPGVTVLGVTTGGLTVDEAQQKLGPRTAAILDQPLVLKVGDHAWTTSARDLGVPLDPKELANSAYSVGRDSSSPFGALSAKLDTVRHGADVPVAEYADGSRLDRLIQQIAAQTYKAPRDAVLDLGDDASIQFTTSEVGLELDQQASRANVSEALAAGAGELLLITRPLQPTITTDQVQAAYDQLTRIFNGQPVQLTAAEHRYQLGQSDLLGIVSLNQPQGHDPATLSFNGDAIQSFVEKVATEVDQSPVDARFAYEGGNLRLLRQSKDGRALDQSAASQLINQQIAAGEHAIDLPVGVAHAAVSSDDGGVSLGIHDLIDESTTSFAGSIPEKAHNIRLAAERLNGVVVPPGGTFSFNKEVGPTTIESGFQWGFGLTTGAQGSVHTVPSVAGGICQVATTLFQPVFWGGYQLEERYWHLYWIPAYTSRGIVGLDATVDSDAGLDFKWINPTNDYVLIQASTDAEHVTFRLYGKKPAWTVQVEQPVISNRVTPDTTPDVQQEPLMQWGRVIPVETARDGFQVVLTRHVMPTDGSKPRDLVLKSIYEPGHNVTLVGTAGAPDGASVAVAVDRVRGSLQPAAAAPTPATASAPAPAAPSTISTPNGAKTLAQIRDELRNAGWGGGSDQDAVATYNHLAEAAKAAGH